jgi:hypothetical protein
MRGQTARSHWHPRQGRILAKASSPTVSKRAVTGDRGYLSETLAEYLKWVFSSAKWG